MSKPQAKDILRCLEVLEALLADPEVRRSFLGG